MKKYSNFIVPVLAAVLALLAALILLFTDIIFPLNVAYFTTPHAAPEWLKVLAYILLICSSVVQICVSCVILKKKSS